MKIILSGFGKLFFEVKKRFGQGTNVEIDVPDSCSVKDIFHIISLDPNEVEAVFINGRVQTIDNKLQQGDRVGLIPYGVPGPYRFLLNIKKGKGESYS